MARRVSPLTRPPTDITSRGRGLAFRLLMCDHCRAVWPTERDEAHGGSRQDGEPCAYTWRGGAVCKGRVWPIHEDAHSYRPPGFDSFREPSRDLEPWWQVLGFPSTHRNLADVRRKYRELARAAHPDAGGSHDAMVRLNLAYRAALSELGQPGT